MVVAVQRLCLIWDRPGAGLSGGERHQTVIPIKTLVRDGCWLKCTARSIYAKGELTFRMRILSFDRFVYTEIERGVTLRPIEEGAVRWLMMLEVVNLGKVSELFGYISDLMRVVDADGFQFERESGDAGLTFSDFAKRTGLSLGGLLPKIKAQGAVIFKVADEDMEYSLTFRNGTMEEI